MADRRRSTPLPKATVASARRLGPPKRGAIPQPPEWTDEAWAYYDSVGEVRAASSWYANGLSRVRLGLAIRGRAGEEPQLIEVDDDRNDYLEGLAGGETGQSQLLSSFGPHLVVAGEAYLVATDDPLLGRTSRVLSASELRATDSSYEWLDDTGKWAQVPDDALPVLVRRSHPRRHAEADSPIRAVLPILRELALLSAHIDAAATSRLAGAGVLAIPSEATFAASPGYENEEDPFVAELIDSMLTPIGDRDDPSAMVPIVIRVPGEYLDKIQHLTFSTPFDERALGLREEAIRRFANGVDMPAAALLGIEAANHWTAWQIEETGIKMHLVPMLETIVQGITVGWWRPLVEALRADGVNVDDLEDLIVWYDVSGLIVRPDRSNDAKDLYRLEDAPLSLTALFRETGFDTGDLAEEPERFRLIVTRLLASRPDLAEALLPVAFPTLAPSLTATDLDGLPANAPVRPPGIEPGGSATPPADGPPPQPTEPIDESPSGDPIPASSAPPLLEVAADAFDGLMFRALEHAGNRLRNRARSSSSAPSVPAVEVHLHHRPRVADLDRLLDGVWARVPVLAERYGLAPERVTAVLDAYARRILRDAVPYAYEELRAEFLAEMGADPDAG